MNNKPFTPLRLLVVDDEKILRTVVRLKLQKLGHHVTESESGELALEVIKSQPIDLIVSDWMMPPGIDGVHLCRMVRARRDQPYIYFILMSGRDTREDLLEGLNAGADDFLRKPLDLDELVVRVRTGQRLIEMQAALNERNMLLKNALDIINADILAASEFQKELLPGSALDSTICSFNWLYLPSSRVSGDALNCFRLDQHHVGFYNVDVAGHGVASAMLTMLITQSLDPRSAGCLLRHTTADGTVKITTPAKAMHMLNLQMTNMALGSNYLTCLYGILDERNGQIQFVRAGHTMPIVVHTDGQTTLLDEDGDMPVGLFESTEFHNISFTLKLNERLCIYSDGVSECQSPDEVAYGVERLASFLGGTIGTPIEKVTQGLTKELRRWSCSAKDAFEDDVSMLIIEYANSVDLQSAVEKEYR